MSYDYDLYRDGITYSGLSRFLACPHQFYLRYCEGWKSRNPSVPIAFGRCFHDLAETDGDPTDAAKQWVCREREKGVHSSEQLKKVEMAALTVAPLVEAYRRYYAEADGVRRWLCRETDFRFELPLSGVPIRGKWDGLFTTDRRKRSPKTVSDLWVHEIKTKSIIDEHTIVSQLLWDFQTMLYALAVRYTFGRCPTGILYDVIRRPGLRQRKDETDADFVKRTRADIFGGRMEMARGKTKAGAGLTHYFYRWTHTLTDAHLDRWSDVVLKPVICRLERWWNRGKNESPHHYVNPEALVSKFGPSDYFEAITRDDYSGLIQADRPHTELEETQ